MTTEYERVLREWALAMIPVDLGATRVTDVSVNYERGFGGSDVTPPDDPTLLINIRYVTSAGADASYWFGYEGPETTTIRMSELLQDLFRIAETSAAKEEAPR